MYLDSKSFWLDEGLVAQRVTMPLARFVRVVATTQVNMCLYYVAIRGWALIAGESEFMLRLPSAIFSTIAVPIVYRLGAELRDRRTGLVGALLVAVNATCIEYAQTARSYALLMMLVALSSLFFIRSVRRRSLASEAGYVISGTCGVYAHLFAVLAVPPQWLSLFLFRPGRKTSVRLTVSAVLIALLSIPMFFTAISNDYGQVAWIPRPTGASVARLFIIFAGVFDGRRDHLALVLGALYLLAIVTALVRASKRDRAALGYLLLSIGFPICLTLVVSIFKPLFISYYLLPGLPFFALLAAMGIVRIKPRALAIAVVALIVALSLREDYSWYRAAPIQDWRNTVNFIAARAHPGDVLVVYPAYYSAPIEYYVSRLDHPAGFPTIVYQPEVAEPGKPNAGEPPQGFRSFRAESGAAAHRRIWFTFPGWSPTGEDALREIMVGRRATSVPRFPGVRLILLEPVQG